MAQAPHADWVNFQEIKAKVRFEDMLGHFGLWNGIEREGEHLSGPCPICKAEGFTINLTKGSFSCPGCKKRGSVIDFTAAYKKVGLKEAGKLLMEILQASIKPQVKESPGVGKTKRRKGKAETTPASLAQALKEEIMATARALQDKLKEAQGLAAELMAKLEGKV